MCIVATSQDFECKKFFDNNITGNLKHFQQ